MLSGAGFKQVFTMTGGIDVWNGLRASGAPDAGMAVFSDADTAEDLLALAWVLEEGSRKFYAGVSRSLKDDGAVKLFQQLTAAEEKHKESLVRLYGEISGSPLPVFSELEGSEGLMEGGIPVGTGLSWAKNKGAREILQFSMAMETNAYDLYLKMIPRMTDEKSARVFKTLAEEEKGHLDKLGKLLEQRV